MLGLSIPYCVVVKTKLYYSIWEKRRKVNRFPLLPGISHAHQRLTFFGRATHAYSQLFSSVSSGGESQGSVGAAVVNLKALVCCVLLKFLEEFLARLISVGDIPIANEEIPRKRVARRK